MASLVRTSIMAWMIKFIFRVGSNYLYMPYIEQ